MALCERPAVGTVNREDLMRRADQILRTAVAAAALLATTPAGARTVAYLPEQGALFEQALGRIALDPKSVRVDSDEAELWGGAKYRPPRLDLFLSNPWKISAYTRIRSENLLSYLRDPARAVAEAHQELGVGVRVSLVEDPLDRYGQRVAGLGEDALAYALGKLTGRSLAAFRTEDYAAVPPAVREAAARILLAVPDVLAYRERALIAPIREEGWDPQEVYDLAWDYAVEYWDETKTGEEEDPSFVARLETLLERVDAPVLNAGAVLLALVVEDARRSLADARLELPETAYRLVADTPHGRVVIAGTADDTYPAADYLLTLDLGGQDFYESAAATRRAAQGVSVSLDLGGFDIYHNPSATAPGPGAGVLGYAVLIDQEGNDEYETRHGGEGFGLFGTGLLYDLAGDDQYRGLSDLQGCGIFGTGVLLEADGADRYEIYQYGQGYAYTRGCGLLIDGGGDDEYYAEMEERPNGGTFGSDRHIHFVQGSSSGRRADYIDGHSWAGGVGWLIDGGGNDRYDCDVYGQGAAYWYGLGICVDRSGNDLHRGGWHALGAAPHFGVGICQDNDGDDEYREIATQCLGAGRDWGIGWFEDRAGNDRYRAASLTLGTGDLNGIGVFWDWSGDDAYLARGTCLGQSRMEQAGTLRDPMLTLGLFVDGGGRDRYLRLSAGDSLAVIDSLPPLDFAGDGRIWTRATERNRVPGAYGVGIDGE